MTDKVGGILGPAAVVGVDKLPKGGVPTATDTNRIPAERTSKKGVPISDFEKILQDTLHKTSTTGK